MKWKVLVGVGVVLSLIGVVWILQGLNQLGGSPMTGVVFWAQAGLASLIVGLALLYVAFRIGRKPLD